MSQCPWNSTQMQDRDSVDKEILLTSKISSGILPSCLSMWIYTLHNMNGGIVHPDRSKQ